VTLSLVLHTHMPYVEGYGVWPSGEEWLWEAIATTYLPLADVLDRHAPAPLTLSITPVLADQLRAPGVGERFLAFCRDLRVRSHGLDAEEAAPAVAAELRRAAGAYAEAADAFERRGGDVLGALAPHVSWTSSATHAVLPLVATRDGVRLQVGTGVTSYRERFGEWRGGFWLPECAHAPWLDPLLEEAGVHATCVDLTDVLGPDEHLRPLRSAAGPLLVPIDRQTIELVWADGAYPGAGAYRDSHHLTRYHHKPWANDGAVYDPARAAEQVRADARDFVTRVRARTAAGGLCVCAVDTELLGHWWHEGVLWLEAVLEEASAQGLPLASLDDALLAIEPVPAPADLPVTTWGTPRDLWTWSGPQVADIAFATRQAELDVLASGGRAGTHALRELLALQASDWAFLASRDQAGPYPRDRIAGHLSQLRAALAAGDDAPVRALAPFLAPSGPNR
jgi:1,4-alpha-glucan branching enzyme